MMNFLIIFKYGIQYILLNCHLALLALGVYKRGEDNTQIFSSSIIGLGFSAAFIPGSSHRFPRAALSHLGNKLVDTDGSWNLEKETLEAEFGEAVPWACTSCLSLN